MLHLDLLLTGGQLLGKETNAGGYCQHSDTSLRIRGYKMADSGNGTSVKISWTVIFMAVLTCVGLGIGYSISETRSAISKCEVLQKEKLDAVIYYEQHRALQVDINTALQDIKTGQREMQKMLVEHMSIESGKSARGIK
jgi:hypothetical protein